MGPSKASLVVALSGSQASALACLQGIAGQPEHPGYDVIVVAHGAPWLDDLLARLDGDVHLVRREHRLALSEAFALGLEHARGEIVVLLHDGVVPHPGWLPSLIAAFDDDALAMAASVDPDHPSAPVTAAPAIALRSAEAWRAAAAAGPDELVFATTALSLAQDGRRVVSVAASRAGRHLRGQSRGGHAPGSAAELTIVIPTLDATSPRLRACLQTLGETTDAPHQIVVVDNGSPPQGFTAPVNLGVRGADTPYVVVMNDDVETLPGWWAPLRSALDAGAAVTFPLTVDGGMREDFAAWCFAMTADTVEQFAHAPGFFFDPELSIWFQDTDLLARLRAAGRPPELVRESHIRHGLSQTLRSEDPALSAWVREQVARDHDRFCALHPDTTLGAVALAR